MWVCINAMSLPAAWARIENNFPDYEPVYARKRELDWLPWFRYPKQYENQYDEITTGPRIRPEAA